MNQTGVPSSEDREQKPRHLAKDTGKRPEKSEVPVNTATNGDIYRVIVPIKKSVMRAAIKAYKKLISLGHASKEDHE